MRYCELAAAVERLAERLAADVSIGQRVAIVAPNVPALVVGLFSVWRLGGVAVPVNARNREYDLRRTLADARVAAVVSVVSFGGYSFAEVLPRLLPELPAVRRCLFVDEGGTVDHEVEGRGARSTPVDVEPSSSEIALILYTSGTTGVPKGALITHASEVAGAGALNELLAATPDDVSVFVVPIAHAFGMTCFLASVACGGRAVLVDSTFSLEPMVAALQRHAASILHGSPALWSGFLKSASRPLPTLRTGFVAGATCPRGVLQALDGAGLRILNLYGMTEIGAASCCRPADSAHVRYTTVGRPLPGYTVRVTDDEVQVNGSFVTPGYYKRPDQTAASFENGWFRTGDQGSLDADGNLTISGRTKDVVLVAGHSVFPAEVEGFLLTHPDVLQAVVVGVPHASLGESLRAFVVARHGSGLTPAALLQFARPQIAGYKLPYSIYILPELPALSTGKPDRAALANWAKQAVY
jgi:acyl-CoA synthetase (AMP-forming)/AMP-acid ligase II